MFFLGSFNSAIPYIVYLSVVWAFMLIGMSGGLSFFRNTEQVNPDHQIIAYQPDSGSHSDFSNNSKTAFNWVTVAPDSDPPLFIAPLSTQNIPGTEGRLIGDFINVRYLRGPPHLNC